MARYFIELSFKGTVFHGWQLQPNATSVQEAVNKALTTLIGESIITTGAGRTDTGVHARFYAAHFDTESNIPANRNDFLYKINALLHQDIAIQDLYPVKTDAHARYSAISRTYIYTINRDKDPFVQEFSWHYSVPLDLIAMNKASTELLTFNDFTSFSKLHSDVKTNNCKLSEASWSAVGNHLLFTITGDRFLRNMVRSIVGTMVDIGRGKLNLRDFIKIVEGKNRNLAGPSAPAQGLSLVHITYPDDIRI
jgi:tRNA pseudouridine38-40 synthase